MMAQGMEGNVTALLVPMAMTPERCVWTEPEGLVIFNDLCLKAKLFLHASGMTLPPIAVRAD